MTETPAISAELIFQHRDWLLTVVRSRLRCDLAVAEDLFGAWIVDIVDSPVPIDQVTCVEPWLYRVFVNRATDWARRQQRIGRQQQELQDVPPWQFRHADQQLPPLEILLQSEQRSQITESIEQLPDDDLEILQLKYAHDWSYQQLAQHLGLVHHQVVYRLRQARQRLKSVLLRSNYWAEARFK